MQCFRGRDRGFELLPSLIQPPVGEALRILLESTGAIQEPRNGLVSAAKVDDASTNSERKSKPGLFRITFSSPWVSSGLVPGSQGSKSCARKLSPVLEKGEELTNLFLAGLMSVLSDLKSLGVLNPGRLRAIALL